MIYGHNKTIHRTGHVDVEIGPDGHVVAVWFRCAMLPFIESHCEKERADDLLSSRPLPGIKAIDFETDFEADSRKERGVTLTGIYSHYCNDWDGLTIDETCPEWPCACFTSWRSRLKWRLELVWRNLRGIE